MVAPEHQAFPRFFAGFRLWRHWTSMRFDDTCGVRPDQVHDLARGWAGSLERTKTSGPGKALQVLPWYLSRECYVEVPEWHQEWFRLLREVFGRRRDYFLPLPTEDLEGAIPRRALYSDSVGSGRK